MEARLTFQATIFTLTTAVMYLIWGYLNSAVTKDPKIGIILGGLLALGTYRLTVKTVGFILIKSNRLKKLIFGRYYLGGVWIGCYKGSDNFPVYFIENFEQNFDNLIIRGRAYLHDGSYKGSWISESVNLDIEKGKLIYNYQTDIIDNTYLNQGQAFFNLIRKDESTPPIRLVGFSSDLYNGKKVKSFEIKVSDKNNQNDAQLLIQAKELYLENTNFFGKNVSGNTDDLNWTLE